MLEAVIFDMDGVIVDTEPGYFYAVNEYLSGFQLSVSREFNERLIGISYSRIWEFISAEYKLPAISAAEFIEGMERCRKKRIAEEGYIPIHGTIRLMEALYRSGIKTAIGSSSPRTEIEEVMDAVNIRRFVTAIVSAGDECRKGKPDPEVYVRAAGLLSVRPENCLVIEDSSSGILAAKRAGMYALGYRSSFGNQKLEQADHIVSSMDAVDITLCRNLGKH